MLVFDLDDTLYLERDFAFSGYAYLDGWVLQHRSVAGFGQRCRVHFEAGERRRIFDAACADLGIRATEELIQALVVAYRNHPPRIALCPDAADYLDRYAGIVPLGLISDGPAQMQLGKLSALGLAERFDHKCLTGNWPLGQGKPHPRAFIEMEARAAAGTFPVYVADNPKKDFITPKARSWRTVQIVRPGAVHDPEPPDPRHAADWRIESLDELDAIIARPKGHPRRPRHQSHGRSD
jgi:putative hydrolase of the HAD superfamily